jgi:dihydrofolate reductase
LIDEITLTLTLTHIPVLLGAGIPLFGPLGRDVRLALLATRAFANGYVQSRYRVASGA